MISSQAGLERDLAVDLEVFALEVGEHLPPPRQQLDVAALAREVHPGGGGDEGL